MKKYLLKANYYTLVFFAVYLLTLILGIVRLINQELTNDMALLMSVQSLFAAVAIIKDIQLTRIDENKL